MTDISPGRQPRQLLLATDLSPRYDRALDRARLLALEWKATLTVLAVRQGPGTPEEIPSWMDGKSRVHQFGTAARAELAEEFAGTGISPTLQVAEGDATRSILAAAGEDASNVVIIGASHNVTFQELILGSAAGGLVQGLAQPLLVVQQRARSSYGRIVVASDFTDVSRRALDTALTLFADRRITLYHVLDGDGNASPEMMQAAVAESARFLDRCALPAGARERIDVLVAQGPVTDAIARHVADESIQLVVLGVHRRSAVARVFKESLSDELLKQLPCDTLLVRATGGSDDG